jgi:hypothetical protein
MRIAQALGSLPDLRPHLAYGKIATQSGAIQRKVSTAIQRPGERGQCKIWYRMD